MDDIRINKRWYWWKRIEEMVVQTIVNLKNIVDT